MIFVFDGVVGKEKNVVISFFSISSYAESKESTCPLVLTSKNLVRASGLSFFVLNCRTSAKWSADELEFWSSLDPAMYLKGFQKVFYSGSSKFEIV